MEDNKNAWFTLISKSVSEKKGTICLRSKERKLRVQNAVNKLDGVTCLLFTSLKTDKRDGNTLITVFKQTSKIHLQ